MVYWLQSTCSLCTNFGHTLTVCFEVQSLETLGAILRQLAKLEQKQWEDQSGTFELLGNATSTEPALIWLNDSFRPSGNFRSWCFDKFLLSEIGWTFFVAKTTFSVLSLGPLDQINLPGSERVNVTGCRNRWKKLTKYQTMIAIFFGTKKSGTTWRFSCFPWWMSTISFMQKQQGNEPAHKTRSHTEGGSMVCGILRNAAGKICLVFFLLKCW